MTDRDLARQVARAFMMYLGDAQETDTEPSLEGEDGFSSYLAGIVAETRDGLIGAEHLKIALHNEEKEITQIFSTDPGFDAGYAYAVAEMGEVCECGHDLDDHNEDGGCRATDDETAVRCECRAYEAE